MSTHREPPQPRERRTGEERAMLPQISHDTLILWSAACLVAFVGLVVGMAALLTALRTNRRLRRWKTIHSSADLEQVYERTLQQVEALKREVEGIARELESLREELRHKVSTPGILRFNAFSDMGSDLSFSLALLDDRDNGVVLSSIYGREESRVFAKPVRAGRSEYPLTDEETQAIDIARNGGDPGASPRSERAPDRGSERGKRPVRV
ncbi:MAG: DUF4446 family protein [Alicyclobacillus sp.]|nr:DUF4446 family protein [Alicyclobacillus sp.]